MQRFSRVFHLTSEVLGFGRCRDAAVTPQKVLLLRKILPFFFERVSGAECWPAAWPAANTGLQDQGLQIYPCSTVTRSRAFGQCERFGFEALHQ